MAIRLPMIQCSSWQWSADNAEILVDTEDYQAFKTVLAIVCQDLAKNAADGEGATKLIEVNVTGAR